MKLSVKHLYNSICALNTRANTASAVVNLTFVHVRAVVAITGIASWTRSTAEATWKIDALDARIN
jgi:hypothetical protein